MCDKVGKETGGFREVLGRLVRDGECELKLIFISDRLYEDNALVVLRSVRRFVNSK
jgi:hypothetical protein